MRVEQEGDFRVEPVLRKTKFSQLKIDDIANHLSSEIKTAAMPFFLCAWPSVGMSEL